MSEKESRYAYTKKTAWELFTKDQINEAMKFAEEYKDFLDEAKTEREAVDKINELSLKNKKMIMINKGKSSAVIVKGEKPINEGVRIIISHIDSPRLDLKQVPLYEDADSHLALLETHYYGGIKKFHWVVIPLALHGVVITRDNKKIKIAIGENDDDPVFTVPDLLPHLSHDVQDNKKLDEAIKGENLDIIVGSIPIRGAYKNRIKTNIIERLHREYGLSEEDFISAELEAVPAFKACDVGLDRSLVGGYGQDDRVCAYTSLQAILNTKKPAYTAIALFVDKEEVGSEGNTTAQVTTFLRYIMKETDPSVDIDEALTRSKVISADVNSAVTPNYTEVFELKNASTLGNGVVMSKYTGHGGKYASHDSSAEFVAEIRALLNKNRIPWQTGEIGKVDKGGGGTVAKYFSRLGMDVIDLGVPVLSMHSPFEITSKVDIYSAYLAYKAFLNS